MKNQKVDTATALLIAAIVFLFAGGWIANIVKLVGMLDGELTAMFIARIVGIFVAPFGAILGFF